MVSDLENTDTVLIFLPFTKLPEAIDEMYFSHVLPVFQITHHVKKVQMCLTMKPTPGYS